VSYLRAVRLSRMQKIEGSNPASSGGGNTPQLLASGISRVRNRDQTAALLSRFRIRSGNWSRERPLPCPSRRGPNNPARDLEDLPRAHASLLSDVEGGAPISSTKSAATVRTRKPLSTQQRASGSSDGSSTLAASAPPLLLIDDKRATPGRWRICFEPSACSNSARPSGGGVALPARKGRPYRARSKWPPAR
jgi:hypothetical protein